MSIYYHYVADIHTFRLALDKSSSPSDQEDVLQEITHHEAYNETVNMLWDIRQIGYVDDKTVWEYMLITRKYLDGHSSKSAYVVSEQEAIDTVKDHHEFGVSGDMQIEFFADEGEALDWLRNSND